MMNELLEVDSPKALFPAGFAVGYARALDLPLTADKSGPDKAAIERLGHTLGKRVES